MSCYRESSPQWELFDGARHMCFVEQTDRYCDVLSQWLNRVD